MPTYPRNVAERQEVRADMRFIELANAVSPRCRADYDLPFIGVMPQPLHAPDPGGCTDDGSGCLCPCHDREE